MSGKSRKGIAQVLLVADVDKQPLQNRDLGLASVLKQNPVAAQKASQRLPFQHHGFAPAFGPVIIKPRPVSLDLRSKAPLVCLIRMMHTIQIKFFLIVDQIGWPSIFAGILGPGQDNI